MRSWIRFALLGFAAPCAAQVPVLVVDDGGGPGVDYSDLQSAALAAPEGATLLVRSGTYGALAIDAKSLVVCADAGAHVAIARATVSNLSALQPVTLRGLSTADFWGSTTPQAALSLSNDAGSVRVESCRFVGSYGCFSGVCFSVQNPGAQIENCADAVLVNCDVIGGPFWSPAGSATAAGAPGCIETNSQVFFFDSSIHGGAPAAGINPGPIEGAKGLIQHGGFVFAEQSEVVAGAGLLLDPFGGGWVPFPGVGWLLADGSPQAVLFDSTTTGIPGLQVASGSAKTLTGKGRTLSATSPLREFRPGSISVAGQPGDLAVLGVSLTSAQLYLEPLFGAVLLGDPIVPFVLGTLDASGQLTLPVTFGELGPGVEAFAWQFQAGCVATDGQVYLANPLTAVVIDAGL